MKYNFQCHLVDDKARDKVLKMKEFDSLVISHDIQIKDGVKTGLRVQIHLHGKLVMQSAWKGI